MPYGDLSICHKEPLSVWSQRTIPARSAKLRNKLTPLTPEYLELLQTWIFPYICQWFSGTESGGGGKVVNPGTEDSMWLVINLRVMSGHAKKLLQEILRHELGVTATPWMLFMYLHAYTTVSKRQFKAVYFSVKDQLLCACHKMTALRRTITAKLLIHLSPAIAYSMVTGLYTHIFSTQSVLGSTCLFILYFQKFILSYIHTG